MRQRIRAELRKIAESRIAQHLTLNRKERRIEANRLAKEGYRKSNALNEKP